MTMKLENKKIIILGAGQEGSSTWDYLSAIYPDCQLTIADQKNLDDTFFGKQHTDSINKIKPEQLLFADQYPESLEKWDITVASPGFKPDTELLDSAHKVTTATNIFFRDCLGIIIGVTGSKGKSTTASLIAHILQQDEPAVHLVGNIGKPALIELIEYNSPDDIFIFELSSYQTSRLVAGPDIAVILNLFPEHIDYHRSISKYYMDKLQITMKQTADQRVYYNSENKNLNEYIQNSDAVKINFPDQNSVHAIDDVLLNNKERIIETNDIPLSGKHNLMNVIAAATCCVTEFSIDNETIAQALRTFQALPHRLETAGTWKKITFIDDAISTTPESTIAALETVKNVNTIILGGQDRAYDFSELAKELKMLDVKNVILFPDADQRIMQAFKKINYKPNIMLTDNMEETVRFAYNNTAPNTTCLLSCAAPSYSIFKNFQDKGDQFKFWAKKLGAIK